MNEKTLENISAELASRLTGQKFGKIFALSRFRLAIDFRLHDSNYLFISVEPSAPHLYLITRRLRDLEKESKNSTPFIIFLRSKLANSVLQSIEKFENERILRFAFSARNEIGQTENYALIVQLTGTFGESFSARRERFLFSTRCAKIREKVSKSTKNTRRLFVKAKPSATKKKSFPQGNFESLSEALDAHFLEIETEKVFQSKVNSARNKLNQETKKREKLLKNLNKDLANHGDADDWKRLGDLLLANIALAKREGDKVFVTDFYDENTPTVEIEVEEHIPLTEAAESFFKRYTKSAKCERRSRQTPASGRSGIK